MKEKKKKRNQEGGFKKNQKNPSANAGDTRDSGLNPGLGRSPGVGNGYPLQYSCLENPMERGDWQVQSIESQRVGHD